MSSATATRQAQQERTRELLLDAAAGVFARRGYHRARLTEIAEEAGLSTGAVYSNFSGKEELFLALADRAVSQRVAEIRRVSDRSASPAEADEIVAEQFRSFIERDPAWPLLFYEFWTYGIRNPRIRREFGRRRGAVRAALTEALETTASSRGLRLRREPEQLATALSAVINGMTFERAADPAALSDETFAFVIGALLPAFFEPATQ